MTADILRRSMAPIAPETWEEIDEEARRVLRSQISARKTVEVDGPHGWGLGAVNLGRLDLSKKSQNGVDWGMRVVQPLLEVRVPFTIDQMEIDSVPRGATDMDFGTLGEAAKKIVQFEEDAIYNGCDEACIQGIAKGSPHKAVPLSADGEKVYVEVAKAIETLEVAGVGGPYTLVLGTKPHQAVTRATQGGRSVFAMVKDLVRGEILWSPAVTGGVLISQRGGDYKMVLGQDLSIGYWKHDEEKVHLYITESFTFRVLEPAAAVVLKSGK